LTIEAKGSRGHKQQTIGREKSRACKTKIVASKTRTQGIPTVEEKIIRR